MLDTLKDEYINLFKNDFVFGRDAKELRRLKDLISAHGGKTDRRSLLHNSHLKARQFEEYLNTLMQTGEVVIEEDRTPGRPKQILKLVKQ